MNVTYTGKSHLDISIESYLFHAMTSMRLSCLLYEFIRQIERSQLNLPRVCLQEVVFRLYLNFTVLKFSNTICS